MRILIIRISSLGDAIHSLPALDIFKKKYPEATIDWLVQEKILDIANHVPGINKIYVLKNNFLNPKNIIQTLCIIKNIRNNCYDLVIDFQGLCKTSILVLAIDAPSIGFGWHSAREPISCWAQTYSINPPKTTPIIDKNITLVIAAANILTKNTPQAQSYSPATLSTSPQASKKTIEHIASWVRLQKKEHLILLAPNTTWPSKHWPLIRWQELIKILNLADHTVVLIGKKFGAQASQLASFIEHNNLQVTIAPPWTLEEIFAVMKHVSVIVAPDTGLLHIADCLGVATIGLYGPTLVARHGPQITPNNRIHCFQVNCPHQYEKTHAKSANHGNNDDCMLMLDAGVVASRLVAIINERNRA